MLPYTAETLFALFDEYNRAIRPLLGLALFLAAGVLMLVIRARNDRTKIVLGILAAGCAVDRHRLPVHLCFGDKYRPPIYAAAFILQGLLLIWAGVFRGRLVLQFDRGVASWAGIRIAIIAAFILPVIDWLSGVGWTDVRLALLAPGATAGFTLGILITSKGPIPIQLVALPVIWTFIAGVHAWMLDIPHDYLLPVIGIIGLAACLKSRNRIAT